MLHQSSLTSNSIFSSVQDSGFLRSWRSAICTADTLHAYLRNLEGAGSPHSYVCNKTAQVIQDLKKKKKRLRPFSALAKPLSRLLAANMPALHVQKSRPKRPVSARGKKRLLTELLLDLKWCSNLHRSVDFNRVYVLLKGQICFKHFVTPCLGVLMCFFFDLPTALWTFFGGVLMSKVWKCLQSASSHCSVLLFSEKLY